MKRPELLFLLALISPAVALSSVDPQADSSLLLSRPLSVLVVRGGRLSIEGELTIRDGRAIFRMRNGTLYSLPLEEIDIRRTARENGIPEAERKRLAEPESAAQAAEKERKDKEAEVATMQTVTTVGLAAREGGGRITRDSRVPGPGTRWTFFTGITSVGETNINRQTEGTADVGVIPVFGLNYRNRRERATIGASYAAAFHSYSRSEEWNRTSHNLSASFEKRRGRWRSETGGEISIKGANEDRDLSDRYSLTERLRFRLTERAEVRLSAGYRVKLYDDDPSANARNPYGGIDYRLRMGSSTYWNLGYRSEMNLAEVERRAYRRETMATGLTFSVAPGSLASIGVRRLDQDYPNRLVRVDGELVPRQDESWLGSFSVRRRFLDTHALALEYHYERRLSNDPDREFDGHSVGLSLIRFW